MNAGDGAVRWPTDAASRTAAGVVAVMLALLAPTIVAYALDERLFNGVDVWLKPTHFQLAVSVHFAALVILLPLMTPEARETRAVRGVMIAGAGAAVFEVGYIMLQAARDRASHNTSTPLRPLSIR